jgi:hypothetical protein
MGIPGRRRVTGVPIKIAKPGRKSKPVGCLCETAERSYTLTDDGRTNTKGRIVMAKTEIVGLGGFTLSGLLFIAAALRNGDVLSLLGSVVWVVSCTGWILAILKAPRTAARGPAGDRES